jgi:hypothetical protein
MEDCDNLSPGWRGCRGELSWIPSGINNVIGKQVLVNYGWRKSCVDPVQVSADRGVV